VEYLVCLSICAFNCPLTNTLCRATRFFGTLIGLHANYFWLWYAWPEAHDYVITPFACVLLATSLVADVVFAFVFARVRKTEVILPDGRRIARSKAEVAHSKTR